MWEREWEPIVIVLGLVAVLLANPLSPTLVVINGLMISLLGFKLYRTTRQAHRLLREKHVPVAVLIGKSESVADSMWLDIERVMVRWGFEADQYRRDFDVEREDVFMHHEEALPADPNVWLQRARDFRRRIERVGSRLPGRKVFHMFVNGPISLAVGLGASIGTVYEVVVHQWFPGTGPSPYHPVVDFYALSKTNPRGTHFIEDAVDGEFRYVVGEGSPGDTQELYVSVCMARDDPRMDVDHLVEEARAAGRSAGVFHVVQRERRSLESGDDWILCAREILTLVFHQVSAAKRERVHFFLTAPTALAFAVGMGLEHFLPITVHSWRPQEGRYQPALSLEQLARMV